MVISEVVVLRLEKRYVSCYLSNTIVQGSYEFVLPKQLVLYCVANYSVILAECVPLWDEQWHEGEKSSNLLCYCFCTYCSLVKKGPLTKERPPPTFGSISCIG